MHWSGKQALPSHMVRMAHMRAASWKTSLNLIIMMYVPVSVPIDAHDGAALIYEHVFDVYIYIVVKIELLAVCTRTLT